jgi:Protein of unknown function (DUF2511)
VRVVSVWLLVVSLCATAVGCGSTSAQNGSSARSITISKATFHGTWPFTVDAGTLRCEPPQSVVFSANGTDYGVNGSALDAGYKDAKPIWKKDPTGLAPNVSIGDVIDRGLQLCAK